MQDNENDVFQQLLHLGFKLSSCFDDECVDIYLDNMLDCGLDGKRGCGSQDFWHSLHQKEVMNLLLR